MKCPKCGVDVKERNLPDHLQKVHGPVIQIPVRKLAPLAVAALLVVGVLVLAAPRSQEGGPGPTFTTAPGGAASASVGTSIGNLAPDFLALDIFDRRVDREALAPDKPGMIFFTTTYCLPCVQGLRELKRFQQDIGGDSFNVFVAFVDPRETKSDLRAYRERYGFPETWFYALDQDRIAVKYGVRFLDTKFVLDPDGIIRYSDESPATYATWQRALGPLLGTTPSTPAPDLSALRFQEFPDLGRDHLGPGEPLPAYNSDPPTSGPHLPQWAPCTVYASPVPDGNLVHSLEHGAVAILYRPGDDALQARLLSLREGDPNKVLLAPDPDLQGGDVALVAWTKLDRFSASEFSEERVRAFIAAFRNTGPEPNAPC